MLNNPVPNKALLISSLTFPLTFPKAFLVTISLASCVIIGVALGAMAYPTANATKISIDADIKNKLCILFSFILDFSNKLLFKSFEKFLVLYKIRLILGM